MQGCGSGVPSVHVVPPSLDDLLAKQSTGALVEKPATAHPGGIAAPPPACSGRGPLGPGQTPAGGGAGGGRRRSCMAGDPGGPAGGPPQAGTLEAHALWLQWKKCF